MSMLLTLLLALVAVTHCQPARQLESYNVDTSQISVSGFSSGGAMSLQYHVAYSSELIGSASFAGASPPLCAYTGYNDCSNGPENIPVSELWTLTDQYVASGDLDPTLNLVNDKVFLFFGSVDTVVDPGGGVPNEAYFSQYMDVTSIYRNDTGNNCQHGIPHYDRGVPCPDLDELLWGTYINHCNWDGPFLALDFMHGGLTAPDYDTNPPSLNGEWYEYDQEEFVSSTPGNEPWWDSRGFIYVPSGCVDKTNVCKLHVMFHGCGMGRDWIGDIFVKDVGFNEVAELNNIILIYPQVKPSTGDDNGCWDWWGYSGDQMALKSGFQMIATKNTVDRVTGADPYYP